MDKNYYYCRCPGFPGLSEVKIVLNLLYPMPKIGLGSDHRLVKIITILAAGLSTAFSAFLLSFDMDNHSIINYLSAAVD
jgi:hypothetical protein